MPFVTSRTSLSEILAAGGLAVPQATQGLSIAGTVGRKFVQTKDHYDDTKVDEYDKTVLEMRLMRGEEVLLDLDPETPVFAELAEIIQHASPKSLPLYTQIVAAGNPAPTETQPFSIGYDTLSSLHRLDQEWLEALIRKQPDRMDEINWERFKFSKTFARRSCDRETFLSLFVEFRNSHSWCSMEFSDYYQWYFKSSRHLGTDGKLTPEAVAEAGRLLEVWHELTAQDCKYSLCSNLQIHPRHQALFEAEVDAFYASRVKRSL